MQSYLLVLTAVVSVVVIIHGQDTCGVIGTNEEERTANRDHNFYLNTQNPAPCNGTITSFQFCNYRGTQLGSSYEATFAIYRLRASQTDSYDVIIPALTAGRRPFTGLGDNGDFGCTTLTPVVPVTVQAGDVIGACVFDPPDNILQNDIVGEIDDSDRYLMTTGTNGCGDAAVPSTVNSLNRRDSRVLHIHADIVPFPETNIPPTTTLSSASTRSPSFSTTGPSVNTTGTPTGGTGAGATAAAVVIVLIILVVSAVVAVIIVVLLTKKHRSSKRAYPVVGVQDGIGIQDGIDNVLYQSGATNGMAASAEYAEVGTKSVAKSDTQYEVDQKAHEYEEASFSDSSRMYAEVGPYEEVHHGNTNANVYESPLDEQAISYSKLLEKNKEEDIYGDEDIYQVPATREDEIYAQLKKWGVQAINHNDITVVSHLGSGQFGSVEQGQWKRYGTKPLDVALKSLNKEGSEDKLKFLQEAAIMAQFRHPNVVSLHGVVTRGDPMMLVVELATRGDLRELLLSMRPDPGELVPGNTPTTLLRFSQQVALGMQYLSAKGFVHRDLAARNVLVSASNVCKVADFGMSRDLADENYYVSQGRDKIPVKWTAPEAIHYKKYSTASDVWAYGCLLYEIWSVGYKPFEGVPNVKVVRLVDIGERLPPPPGSPRMIYELMILCWHPETSFRPAFRDVVLTLVGSEQMVLNIPEVDSSTNPLAGVLGAPLEAGENMYTDLQKRYDSDEVAI